MDENLEDLFQSTPSPKKPSPKMADKKSDNKENIINEQDDKKNIKDNK